MTFYSTLSRYYEEIFPYGEASCVFLEALIQDGQSMLDAGCGTGALVRHLRQKGLDAKGFDLDKEMVKLAEKYILDELPPHSERTGDIFRQGDLLALEAVFPEKEFDLISCIGNTIAHIPQDGLKVFLDAAFNMLKPGGALVLQTLNYKNIGQNGLPFQDIKTPHCLFKRKYSEEESKDVLSFETELIELDSTQSFKYSTKHFPSYKEDLGVILKERGFSSIEFYGSWKKDPVSSTDLPLIIKAVRI